MKKRLIITVFAIITIGYVSCEKTTDIIFNKNELLLIPNETETLIATVYPDDASNKKIKWKSNNPAVATVNENGMVTAINKGEAIITATTKNGNREVTCLVNVDYRNKWVGSYDFITIDYLYYYSWDIYHPETLVIIHDTTHFVGTIEKHETNRLKIIFKPNATEPGSPSSWPVTIKGLIYPTVDSFGELIYPAFFVYKENFHGSLLDNEINIVYYYYGPLGMSATENHKIHGIKINKK